jgi:hypothetical protein
MVPLLIWCWCAHVPWDDGVEGVAPVVLDDMEVGVADPAEEHLDRHIVVLGNAVEASRGEDSSDIQIGARNIYMRQV